MTPPDAQTPRNSGGSSSFLPMPKISWLGCFGCLVIAGIGLCFFALSLTRKDPRRNRARRILEDLRIIDGAIDQYAIETNKHPGDRVEWADIKAYLKIDSSLYETGSNSIGGVYSTMQFNVGGTLKTPIGTSAALSDVAPPSWWSPYILQ